jgi:murein L,D-transpeptidase YafK
MSTLSRLPLVLGVLAIPLSAHALSFPWLKPSPHDTAPARVAPERPPTPDEPPIADKIVVKKGERRLYLMRDGRPIRTYRIALGYQPTGNKQYKGDGRTPEGRYYIDQRNERSNYRKALHISYPSEEDRLRAMTKGFDPGGSIMIHGQPNDRNGKRSGDWTFGCVAVSNMEIDEIWNLTTRGTPVEILP